MNRLLRNPSVGLLLLCAVILSASGFGMLHLGPGIVSDASWHLPMLVVALLFGLGEVFVLHVHVRRQRRSVSLSEIPLVLALFFATPYALLLGRLLGGVVVLALLRRQRSAKLLLNLSVFIGESVAALLVFRALLPDDPDSPLAWLAAYVAVFAASCTSHTSVGLAIAMHNGALRLPSLLKDSMGGVAAALAVATFGLLATTALDAEVLTAFLLVLVTGMLVVGYREYSRLSERHLALERLLRFGQVLAASPEVDEVLRSLLVQARELLRSEAAEVTFLPDGDGGRGLRVRLLPDDTLQRTVVEDLRTADPVSAEVVEHGAPVLLERGGEGEAPSQYLALRGQREAVLVPLKGDVGAVGTLAVADRQGEVGTFDRSDVELLQTVADSAASALVKGQLMDQLRQDALHDPLTGLPNRAQLLQVLEAAQHSAQTSPYGVLMLDLNGFKAVNDTLGHERGDVLLKDVARRLRGSVPEGSLVSRLGGDEFAVVVPGGQAEVEAVATRVVDAVRHTVEHGGVTLPVGTALGLALAPQHGAEPALLLRCADVAMYASKRARSGPTTWTPSVDEAVTVVPSPRSSSADPAVRT